MKSRRGRMLLGAALIGIASSAGGERLRTHFDFDALLGQPAFFDFAVLGEPGPARWVVLADDTAPSPPKAAAQVFDSRPDGSIAAALRRNVVLRDGSWSVSVKRGAARAGLVLRLADEKNFVVLLVNCESGDARLLSYRNGRPGELGAGRAAFHAGWARLAVTGSGPKLSATWDGRPLLDASDPDPVSGRAGMATAGSGSASFDELVIETADARDGRR